MAILGQKDAGHKIPASLPLPIQNTQVTNNSAVPVMAEQTDHRTGSEIPPKCTDQL